MDLEIKNKAVIISGGGKGIGAGISLALANEGAIPIILSRSKITEEFKRDMDGKDYDFHEIDLNETDKINPLVSLTANKRGGIYGVVNNAGVNDNKDLESTTWQEFERSMHGNLTHYYELVRSSLPYLKKSKGAILNIASKTALTGQGKTSAYAAAKGAILALTREWAAALLKEEIRVNAIVVAESWTPLYANWIKTFGDKVAQDARLKIITDKIPLGKRMTTTKEIADMATFLLSPLSSHTTGQWIYVDGGYCHLDRAL